MYRRHFLSQAAVLLALPLSQRSHADELTPIAADDSLAKSLDYHANRNKVDIRLYPEFDSSQHCASCKFYDLRSVQAGCKLMPGRQVDPEGWCRVWSEPTV